MNAYLIIELKYDEARPVLELLKAGKVKQAIEYMAQWDYGGENENSMTFTKDLTLGPRYEAKKRGWYIIARCKDEDYVYLYRTTRRNSP